MIGTLLRYHWRRHRVVLPPMMAGLALFHLLITRMAPAPDEVSWITQIYALVPPALLKFAGQDLGGPTAGSFIGLGYAHPFMLIILSAWTVRVASASLAGEIGRGTMDLIASRPVERAHQVLAAFVAVGIGLAALVGAAWAGTAAGLHLRALGVTPSQMARMAFSAWMLFAAWGAVGLAVSAIHRDGGATIGWMAGALAVSFVVEYASRMWAPMARLHPLSLFAYHDPQHIASAGIDPMHMVILGAVAVLSLGIAVRAFARRDL